MKTLLNLLPQEKKAVIEREFRLRFLLWQLSILFAVEVFYLAIIGSAAFALDYERVVLDSAREQVSTERESSLHLVNYEAQFSDANKQVNTVLAIEREHTLFSNMFFVLNDLIDTTIHLHSLTTKGHTASLSGTADTRDDILRFNGRLKESECVQDFRIPLSNLFSQEDVAFQIDIDINPRCLQAY